MDAKGETYYHVAVLASNSPASIGTPKHNTAIRALLCEYGSFKEIYKAKGQKPNYDLALKLKLVENDLKASTLEYGVLNCNDSNFPSELKDKKETTPVIYYQGNLDLLNRDRIAVVGTRKPLSQQEVEEAKEVISDFIKKDYVIVSGLATGCDTLGHQAGLAKGTIAVLGTSLNNYCSRSNMDLQEKIAKEHLLISQFPIGIDYFLHPKWGIKSQLVRRNQTTTALANKGVLVLKTADLGGTLHAIKEVKNFNTSLYAMRCNFNEENKWTDKFEWEDRGLYREAISKKTTMRIKKINKKNSQLEFKDVLK